MESVRVSILRVMLRLERIGGSELGKAHAAGDQRLLQLGCQLCRHCLHTTAALSSVKSVSCLSVSVCFVTFPVSLLLLPVLSLQVVSVCSLSLSHTHSLLVYVCVPVCFCGPVSLPFYFFSRTRTLMYSGFARVIPTRKPVMA